MAITSSPTPAATDAADAGQRFSFAMHKPLMALFVVNIFYYTDRYVLNMLIEPIRLEFGLTDGEIGMLTGLAFAVSYALMTIPFGRMTDRYNRVGILAVAVSMWSLCTAAFGLARSYTEMLIYRIGVACGEAGGFIPIQSLVGDLYKPSWRATAMGILLAGGSIGKLLAYAAAGVMNDAIGWRWTFMILGLAGVVIGPLLWFTIREPRRGSSEGLNIQQHDGGGSAFGAIRTLLGRPAMRGVIGGMTVASIAGYAVLTWIPTYFIRRFDLTTSDAGMLTSVVIVLPQLVGMVAGGFIADRLFARDPNWIVRFPAVVLLVAGPMLAAMVYAPSMQGALLIGVLPAFLMGVYPAALLSAIQYVAGVRHRGTAGALITFALLLVGQGFGPAITGLLSDYFAAGGADLSYVPLRDSLASISLLFIGGSVVLFLFTRTLVADMAAARRFDEAGG